MADAARDVEWVRDNVIAYFKGELSGEERGDFEERLTRDPELRAEVERGRDVLDLLEAASERRVVALVRQMIDEAIRRQASDIHLVPGRRELVVSYRIDGALHEVARHPREASRPIIDRLKYQAELSLPLRDFPQEGRIALSQDGKDYDLRVALMPTVFGERVTVGIFSPSAVGLKLAQLGFPPEQEAALRRMMVRPNGLIAVVGPVGCGKTTVVYSLLQTLLRGEDENENGAARWAGRNIMTVEDPVPYRIEGISQTRVNGPGGLTFATGLHHLFRASDPDVIFVGDVPDAQTTELLMHATLSGHLVLTQLTNSGALGGIEELRAGGATRFQLGQAIAGLVGLRLVPKICPACVTEYEPAEADLRQLGLTLADGPFRKGAGCEKCRNAGYRGRMSLAELVEADDAFRRLLMEEAPLETLQEAAFPGRRGSLLDVARARVLEGRTTADRAAAALSDYPRSDQIRFGGSAR